jgi:hypothetical protein
MHDATLPRSRDSGNKNPDAKKERGLFNPRPRTPATKVAANIDASRVTYHFAVAKLAASFVLRT